MTRNAYSIVLVVLLICTLLSILWSGSSDGGGSWGSFLQRGFKRKCLFVILHSFYNFLPNEGENWDPICQSVFTSLIARMKNRGENISFYICSPTRKNCQNSKEMKFIAIMKENYFFFCTTFDNKPWVVKLFCFICIRTIDSQSWMD